MNKLIQVAIYQTKNSIKLIDRPHFNESMYECQNNIIRMLRCDCSIDFIENLSTYTKQELFDVLNDELNNNPDTIVFN